VLCIDARLPGDVSQCAARKTLRLIVLFTNPVVKSLQKCQSKMTHMAVTSRLAFLYAKMLVSMQSCDGRVVRAVLRLTIVATSIPV